MSMSVLLSIFEIVSFKKKKSPSHVSGPQECGHPFPFADGLSAGETRPVDGERRGRAPLCSHLAFPSSVRRLLRGLISKRLRVAKRHREHTRQRLPPGLDGPAQGTGHPVC